MQASRLEDGERGFAFGIIQAYFIVLVICGALAFLFSGQFLWNNRHEFASLVKVIRFHAAEDDADTDLENGRNDQWEMDTANPEEDDPAGAGYSDTTTEDGEDPNKWWCRFCKEYQTHGWSCSCKEEDEVDWSRPYNEGDHDWSRYTNEREDENDWPRNDNEVEDNEGEGDHDWSRYNNEGDNNEDESEDQHDCPDSNNDSDALHLTPSSSGSDAPVNTTTPGPPTFDNWYAPADDTESCSSCDSDYTKTIPWTTPAAQREPLTPTSPTGYIAGVEDNDDGEESDISDDATIGRSEGGDPETWNNENRSISYGSTPGQGFQSEQEDTGPFDNMQQPSDQTIIAQEQRPRPIGTVFSPPDLPVRHANILADETGHAQGPPVGEFRHGIARPLRLRIPTQGLTNAEPRAPTTPTNSHSLAEWPSRAYAGNSWRDV